MKSVIFRLGGQGTKGDVIVLTAASARGGASHARYFCHGATSTAYLDDKGEAKKRVTQADTPQEIAAGLAEAANRSGEFIQDHVSAAAKSDLLTLACSEVYGDARWSIECQGSKSVMAEEI